jgi:hypothetical protein
MKIRLITTILLGAAMLAAMFGAVARAQVLDTNIEITEFRMAPTTLQAGGNPDISLFFRFCGPGVLITNVQTAPTAGHFFVTTATPHGVINNPYTIVKIRGVRNLPDANGRWEANEVALPGGVFDPNKFELVSRRNPPAGDDAFAADARAQVAPSYGCTGDQVKGRLADFTLSLPPGFLGNPTALEACPTFIWIASSCSDRSILGQANTESVADGAGNRTPVTDVPTPIYNVQTLGLEPARLGTGQLGSEPPGPFPVKISLRTTDDYGIESALFDIPKNLGGVPAVVTQIDTVLCSQVPCKATNLFDPHSVVPLPPTRPFFRNPTSCKTATAKLFVRGWKTEPTTDTATDTFTPDGCGAVPFDAVASVSPTEPDVPDPNQAGLAGSHQVSLAYPEYADAPIWQSNLKDADITLPEGLNLSAGGGNGLEACSFDQFGVNAATGKQENNDPAECPQGSQIGTLSVTSPVLDFPLDGKVFFGPVSAPGRPVCVPDANDPSVCGPGSTPWKLFLLIEGAGLRIKLVGDTTVSESGQVRNVFTTQPEVPFTRLDVNLRGGESAILSNPTTCTKHDGTATLVGWSGTTNTSTPSITPTGCTDPKPFNPVIEEATGIPEKAGANSVSKIVISRQDGEQNIKSIKLSLPAGAVGSLAALPQCALAQAQAGTCPESTKIGTIRNTVGSGKSLLTVPGELFLAEASVPGDAATLAINVPAKVGPIDLGHVVILNRAILRESDSGIDTLSSDIPTSLEGVPLPLRRVNITVDRPGFFLNPTGCDPRRLTATFTGDEGAVSTASIDLSAKQCAELPFGPELRLIAGSAGNTDQFDHPPFKAILTQEAGEADISTARVVLPAIVRPNVPFFNVPGALCTEAQAAARACPPKSLAGSARVVTPVLPYQLSGPVHIVQEVGNVLPKIYVFLRGPTGIEVLLKARNSFLGGRRIINTFEGLPDVPQAYFELSLNGGPNGILNNFDDLCTAKTADRVYDTTFSSHSGKTVTTHPKLEINGCEESDLRAASLSSQSVKVSKKGVAKVKVRCKRAKKCTGRLTLRGKKVGGAGKISISGKKTGTVKVKFSKSEVKQLRKKKRLRAKATATIGTSKAASTSVTLIGPKRR